MNEQEGKKIQTHGHNNSAEIAGVGWMREVEEGKRG